jgi:hypothetical protein
MQVDTSASMLTEHNPPRASSMDSALATDIKNALHLLETLSVSPQQSRVVPEQPPLLPCLASDTERPHSLSSASSSLHALTFSTSDSQLPTVHDIRHAILETARVWVRAAFAVSFTQERQNSLVFFSACMEVVHQDMTR